jgi:probable HAF family extracellular repeat protein
MQLRRNGFGRAVPVVVLLLAGSAGSVRAQWAEHGFTAHWLPSDFGISAFSGALNNHGQVAGRTQVGSYWHASIFTIGQPVQTLGTLGGRSSYAYGINNAGQAVGSAEGTTAIHAFLSSGGTMQDLGSFGGIQSIGYAISDAGHVTGWSHTLGGAATHAFLYSGGTMLDLGTLGGITTGRDVNESGQVTGHSDHRAFLYSAGVMQDLGTLGGNLSRGFAINDAGQVTGYSTTAGDATSHAFLYSAGVMQDLGTLGGVASSSRGNDVSNDGRVVGYARDASGATRAALWANTGSGYQAYDFSSLVNDGTTSWNLSNAVSISDDGRYVLALGSDGTNSGYVVLEANIETTVTPEPMSLLLGAGLTGRGVLRRRRRRLSDALAV